VPSIYGSVREIDPGRKGSAKSDMERVYTRRFRVVMNVQSPGPVLLRAAPGIPILNSFYLRDGSEWDFLSLLREHQVEKENADDWQAWIVTCLYSTRVPTGGPNSGNPDQPQTDPPDIEWDYDIVQYALEKDLNNKAFLNSANMPLTPSPTFPIAHPTLNITRNELNFDINRAKRYAFATNSDTFLGQDKGTCLCFPPKAKMGWRGSFGYWKVSYKIALAATLPDGSLKSFAPQFVDQGTMEWDEDAQKPVPIMPRGQKLTSPVLLDGKGHQQEVGEDGKTIPPFWLKFTIHRSVSFTSLLVTGLGGP
jgi:hypothetical protein